MLARAARLLLRIAGWLLTPFAVIVAAAIGATIGAMVAPVLSPTTGLLVTGLAALAGAIVGLWGWIRMVRGSPDLQQALAVTAEGVPRPEAVDALLHGEVRHEGDGT